MSDVSIESRGAAAPPVPLASPRELAPYAVFAVVLLAVLVYFVGVEQGALSLLGGSGVHEFLHDGRHLLGFPCH